MYKIMPIYPDGFIKPDKLHMLDEDFRSDDLLNRDSEISKFSSKLNEIKQNAIIGFIGPFGSGKSTFLNQYKKQFETAGGKWFDFEAWKYPDRTNLWENFVLEIARGINKDIFDKTIKKIDGEEHKNTSKLLNLIGEIPYLGAVKHFDYFLNTSPAKRTFEVQNILTDLLNSNTANDIVIIVEDIDRSGDAGIYFLETLHHFLSKIESKKNIKIIVPIGNLYYKKNIDSYLKCLDYKHEFNTENIILDRFVSELFIDEIIEQGHIKGQIESFLEGTFKEFGDQMTIRKLKHILRGSNINYKLLVNQEGEGIDPRLSIMFETANNINYPQSDLNKKFSYSRLWKQNKAIGNSDSIFSALIYCLIQENHRIGGRRNISIYVDEHTENGVVQKLYSISKLPIKLITGSYINNTVKDAVLYYTNDFDHDKNYFAILNFYQQY